MQAYDIYADLKHTNNILMELPCFRQMLDENYALSERVDSLKIALEYLESKNRRLSKKVAKYKRMYKNAKKSKTTISKNIGAVIDLVSDDDDVEKPVVVVKKEVVVEKPIVVEPIVMTIEETAAEEEDDQEEVIDDQEEEVVEEEAAEEEAAAEEAAAEEADDQEEEEEEEEEEAEEDEEQEDVVEEEAEEEVVEEQAEEEEEAEVYETVIKGKTYYIQNEKDGPIYEADENGEISLEVGVYKNGKPTFF
jgi:hypothetical protein